MNTRIDIPPPDETVPLRDRTLSTCRPALIEPDTPLPDERDATDPERHIVRGDD
ncbi:hypothetical protein [Streptomyces tritici]|uniref:hypothetical protein n=1 Tax=Streptomyces tritici TaxID=2054410 RepID=UPI003AF0DC0C